jgi:hypothetical protein
VNTVGRFLGDPTDWWDDSLRDRITNRLSELGVKRCPLCSDGRLAVANEPLYLTAARGHLMPVIPVECGSCGYLALLSIDGYLDLVQAHA